MDVDKFFGYSFCNAKTSYNNIINLINSFFENKKIGLISSDFKIPTIDEIKNEFIKSTFALIQYYFFLDFEEKIKNIEIENLRAGYALMLITDIGDLTEYRIDKEIKFDIAKYKKKSRWTFYKESEIRNDVKIMPKILNKLKELIEPQHDFFKNVILVFKKKLKIKKEKLNEFADSLLNLYKSFLIPFLNIETHIDDKDVDNFYYFFFKS